MGRDAYKNKILQSLGLNSEKKSVPRKKGKKVKEEKSTDPIRKKSPKKMGKDKSVKRKGHKKKVETHKRKKTDLKRDSKNLEFGTLKGEFGNPSKIIFNVNNKISVQSPH